VRPPRLRCTLFPLIYPPHLLVLPATFGLHLRLQTYPYFRALYVISVRRTKSLPMTSFRFHLTMDTLVTQLYTSSLPRRIWDFYPLERAHGAQTNSHKPLWSMAALTLFMISFTCLFLAFYDPLQYPLQVNPLVHFPRRTELRYRGLCGFRWWFRYN